jgi:hypothetical protein
MDEERTFTSVLDSGLRNLQTRRNVEVINAGTPNYGTWHELRLLQKLLPELDPDLVVLCVFTGNDLDDNLAPKAAKVENGFLMERVPARGFLSTPVRQWLQRNSMTYVFLSNAWSKLKPAVGREKVDYCRI